MKKSLITLISILTIIAAPALAGVWVAQSSYGPTCYLVKLTNYNDWHLIGTGIVTSGPKFTGYLKAASTQQSGGYPPSGVTIINYSSVVDCTIVDSGQQPTCAWFNAMGGNSSASQFGDWHSFGFQYYSNVSGSLYYKPATALVKDMSIVSAQPTACW